MKVLFQRFSKLKIPLKIKISLWNREFKIFFFFLNIFPTVMEIGLSNNLYFQCSEKCNFAVHSYAFACKGGKTEKQGKGNFLSRIIDIHLIKYFNYYNKNIKTLSNTWHICNYKKNNNKKMIFLWLSPELNKRHWRMYLTIMMIILCKWLKTFNFFVIIIENFIVLCILGNLIWTAMKFELLC